MSGGRWVRQPNGDYQHFTDEEIAEQERSKLGAFFGLAIIAGIVLMFVFHEMLYGAIVTLIGAIGLFIYPSYTIGTVLGVGFAIGFFYLIIKCEDSDEENKKENKTEKVAQAPSSTNTQSNVAAFKAEETNETVDAYDEPDYEEEAEENYSSNENTVDDRTDVMPEFPGGSKALMNYLNANIRFPSDAEENGIQGKVVVSYVIDIDGSVTDVQVVQSVYPSLDKEAMRVVKNMPKWIPGRQDGKAVQVKYSIPINFYYQ